MKLQYLIPLKDSMYVDELLSKIDEWKQNPSNRQLLSHTDDYPCLAFSDNRAENFNDVLGEPFVYNDHPGELQTHDFVCVDTNNEVIGFFHCIVQETSYGTTNVSGLRTYRFNNESFPYRFGKAHREFYEWLYATFHKITMLVVANSDFANGDITIMGKKRTSETLKRVHKQNLLETGFAQPGGLRIMQRYDGEIHRYTHVDYDYDGKLRFFHLMTWLGQPGKELGMVNTTLLQRTDYVLAKLEEAGIYITDKNI